MTRRWGYVSRCVCVCVCVCVCECVCVFVPRDGRAQVSVPEGYTRVRH